MNPKFRDVNLMDVNSIKKEARAIFKKHPNQKTMPTDLHLELYREYASAELKINPDADILTFSEWRELNKEVLE